MSADNMMSSKDVNTFKKLAKCYENKQFRNGLRFAKLILANSKCVNHAETNAYKGMCLSGIGRNEEASVITIFNSVILIQFKVKKLNAGEYS